MKQFIAAFFVFVLFSAEVSAQTSATFNLSDFSVTVPDVGEPEVSVRRQFNYGDTGYRLEMYVSATAPASAGGNGQVWWGTTVTDPNGIPLFDLQNGDYGYILGSFGGNSAYSVRSGDVAKINLRSDLIVLELFRPNETTTVLETTNWYAHFFAVEGGNDAANYGWSNATQVTLSRYGVSRGGSVATPGSTSGFSRIWGGPSVVEGTGGTISGVVNQEAGSAPAVTVKDAAGNPLSGIPVKFTIQSGGGAVASDGSVSQLVNTNSNGVASVAWTLGSSVGSQSVRAEVIDPLFGNTTLNSYPLATTFTATASAPTSASVTIIDGDGQTALPSSILPTNPKLRVTDGSGRGIGNINVVFSVTAGSGSISGASTVTTDADGYAQITGWQLGAQEGTNTLQAAVSGYDTVSFTATASIAADAQRLFSRYEGQIAAVINDRTRQNTLNLLDQGRTSNASAVDRVINRISGEPAVNNSDVGGSMVVTPSTRSAEATYEQEFTVPGGLTRIVSGNISLRDSEAGSRAAYLNGDVSWEKMVSERLLSGVSVGANLGRSDISGVFNGESDDLGLSVRGYFVRQLDDSLYLDGFFGVGLNRTDLTMNTSDINLNTNYDTRTIFTGFGVTGVKNYGVNQLRPAINVQYGHSDVGDIAFNVATNTGSTATVSHNAGSFETASISSILEWRQSLDGLSVADGARQIFTVAPSGRCDYVTTENSSTQDCGVGIDLGFEYALTGSEGMLDVELGRSEIGSRESTRLLAKFSLPF